MDDFDREVARIHRQRLAADLKQAALHLAMVAAVGLIFYATVLA